MIDLKFGNCLEILPTIPSNSVDAIISDPPYPEIKREYGKLKIDEWFDMMQSVVTESRRILKEDGSAVFFLQPNSEKVGQMRTWLWEFMVWCGKEWNIIQDVWWFNSSTPPNVHCQRKYGLMRPAIKACVWLGAPDCRRNQDEVLLPLRIKEHKRTDKLWNLPGGQSMREARCLNTAIERGGSTPYNLIQVANINNNKCAGNLGHAAGTPYKLTDWWVRYLTQKGDTVLDMFSGAATTGLVCQDTDRSYVGIEQFEKYHQIAMTRLGLQEAE